MKFLLTFLVATGLSLPVLAQTNSAPSDQSANDSTHIMGDDSRGNTYEGTQSTPPQSEESLETDSIERTDTDVTSPSDSSVQEEEDTSSTTPSGSSVQEEEDMSSPSDSSIQEEEDTEGTMNMDSPGSVESGSSESGSSTTP